MATPKDPAPPAQAAPAEPYSDLPRWLWLWFPPLVLVLQYGTKLVSEELYLKTMDSELGFVENATALWLVVAAIAAALTARDHRAVPVGHLRGLLALFALGAFVFMGEEVSWGQHWFRWRTPEAWAQFNERGETSIHNASAVFDQLPRSLLTAAALVAIVVPVARRLRGRRPTGGWRYWLLPTYVCLPACVLALVITWPKKLFEGLLDQEVPRVLAISPGETKEYFLAIFLMLYALSLRRRLAQWSAERGS